MIGGLLVFLVGCLVLAVILYAFNLVLGMISLPEQLKQLALLIVGLICLLLLIMLAIRAATGGAGVVITL